MPTTRDLAEAQAFERRRVVAAFVSGAPADPQVERTRPGRILVGGAALAVLLVAGALIVRLLTGGDPPGWDRPGLLVSEDTGELFVVLEQREDPVLHPVATVTSARLLLGPDAEPTLVSGRTIAAQEIGPELGVPGTPAVVPEPAHLVGSGWSACTTAAGGLAVALTAEPSVHPVTGRGLTVVSGGRFFVVAPGREDSGRPGGAYRYALPSGVEADALLTAIGLPITAAARPVPERWLRLFPSGGSLDFATLGLQGYGGPAPGQGPGGLPAGSRIGQVVTTDGEHFQVLTAAGPAELDAFARAVYASVDRPPLPVPLDLEPVILPAPPRVRAALPPFAGAHWPADLLGEQTGEPCALLRAAADEPPAVLLARDPTEASPTAGPAAPAEQVRVAPGYGALARVDGGTSYLVDARGAAHPLHGTDTAERLGLGAARASRVPENWIELLERGVALSRTAALCPPARAQEPECR